MADFPPNLDDGELWLPSDIFKYKDDPYSLSCMDDLAQHFTALSFLQNHPPKPPSILQRVKPAVTQLPRGCFGFNGGGGGASLELSPNLHLYGSRRLLPRSEPFYEFQIQPQQQQQQVDSCLLRARILQRQQNRLQNWVQPFRFNNGGFARQQSGGTGVFIPRIVKQPTSTATATTDVKRRHYGWQNGGQECAVTQERNSTRRVGVNKQEDCYYHLPPEMGLPKDWTY